MSVKEDIDRDPIAWLRGMEGVVPWASTYVAYSIYALAKAVLHIHDMVERRERVEKERSR